MPSKLCFRTCGPGPNKEGSVPFLNVHSVVCKSFMLLEKTVFHVSIFEYVSLGVPIRLGANQFSSLKQVEKETSPTRTVSKSAYCSLQKVWLFKS